MSDPASYEARGRKWLRRLAATAVLLAAAIARPMAARAGEGAAKAQLDAQVAAYRKAGEPIEPGDFKRPPVPDRVNAATDLRRAGRSIDNKTAVWRAYEMLEPALPLTEEEIAAIDAVVRENGAAIVAVSSAAGKPEVDWQIELSSPLVDVRLPDLAPMRTLGNLLRNKALLEHQRGDDAAAVEDVRRILFIGRATGRQPMLVSHLVGRGLEALATWVAEQVAPDLKIATGGGSGGAAGRGEGTAVTSTRVKELIALLLDDGPCRAGLRSGLLGERAMELDAARSVAEERMDWHKFGGHAPKAGAPGGGGHGGGAGRADGAAGAESGAATAPAAVAEMACADGLAVIRHTTATLAAAQAANDWPGAEKALPAYPSELQDPRAHPLAAVLQPAVNRAIQTGFRTAADRRMAAVALAVRLYQVETGKPPATLDALVPKYLPAVPADPMAAGAPPLKYKPDADPPIVYSVGDDGVDDGGSTASASKTPTTYRWGCRDAVMPLRRPRRGFERFVVQPARARVGRRGGRERETENS